MSERSEVLKIVSAIPQMSGALDAIRQSFSDRERRITDGEVRADQGRKIGGYAAMFGKNSVPMFGMTESIRKGAFSDALGSDDVRALFNHDPNLILGRNLSKTLTLSEDGTGLRYDIPDIPETTYGNDLLVSVRRGDISQSSFGFRTVDDEWSTKDGKPHRELIKVRLFDVSPVTYPAYPQTSVSARAFTGGTTDGSTTRMSAAAAPESLASALVKIYAGLALSPEDQSAVEGIARSFSNSLPGSADEGAPAWRRNYAERRIRLAEAE